MNFDKIIEIIGKNFRFLLIIAIILGYGLALLIKRLDLPLITNSLIIVIPVIISILILPRISSYNFDFGEPVIFFQQIPRQIFFFFFCILFIITLIILQFCSYRPWYYFLFLTVLYVVVFLQILSFKVNPVIILIELLSLMLNSIYGITLKYPLYFGMTDILGHIRLSYFIYVSGTTPPPDLDITYTFYPLYHIIVAECAHITGLSVEHTLFLVTGLIFVITIIFIYILFNQILKNFQLSLLICLVFSLFSDVIFYSSYMITRTMAFVGFVILLYLLFKIFFSEENEKKFQILAIIISLFLLLVHQVSLPLMIPILGVIFIIFSIFYGTRRTPIIFFILLITIMITYWIFTARIFTELLIENQLAPEYFTEIIFNKVISPKTNWLDGAIVYLQQNITVSIFLVFALIAIGYILWHRKPKNLVYLGIISFLFLPFFIPTPLQSVWQFTWFFRLDRIRLIISPFMAFIMGFGLIIYLKLVSLNPTRVLFSIIIVIFSIGFFSYGSFTTSMNAGDSIDLWDHMPSPYFTNQELSSFKFVENYGKNDETIYSDAIARRYFGPMKNFSDAHKYGFVYFISKMLDPIKFSPDVQSLILYRKAEFYKKNVLNFEDIYYKYSPQNALTLENKLNDISKIFSSKNTEIFSN